MCMLQIVLENSSREDKHECPFGRSSIELTKMLCEILKVGELRKCHHFHLLFIIYFCRMSPLRFIHFGLSLSFFHTC